MNVAHPYIDKRDKRQGQAQIYLPNLNVNACGSFTF